MSTEPSLPVPSASCAEAPPSSSKVVLCWVLAHAAIAGVLANVLNVWLDEAFSLETSGAGIAAAFRRSLTFEMQPPLYFTMLAAWRSIASGYVFARMLSLACTVGVLWIVGRLWQRLRPDVHPGWIVAALAFHPFTIYAAVEIRLYASAMLLSALLVALYLGEYAGEGRSPARKLAFTAVSVAALWTQYYLGFLLAVQGAVLVLRRRWQAVRHYLLAMLVAAVALAPFVRAVSGQLEGHAHGAHEPFGIVAQVKFVYTRLAYYLLPRETESPRAVKLARDLVMLASAGALAVGLVRKPRPRLSPTVWSLGAIVAGLTICYVVTVQLTGTQEMVLVRHTVGVFVPVVLLGFLLLAELGGRRAVASGAALVLVFDVAALAATYLPAPAKRGDWQRVARFVEAREEPGQPILVFRAPTELPLRIHYAGPNRIVPIPGPNDADHWRLTDSQLHSTDDVMRVVDALEGRPDRLWLVTDTIWSAVGVEFHHDVLERCVTEHFDAEVDQAFFASRVRLLRRRPSAAVNTPTATSGSSADAARSPVPAATAPQIRPSQASPMPS